MSWDPVARHYRWIEYAVFGRALERRRNRFLGDIGDVRKVLVIGEGDGRFLAAFAARYPRAIVDYMDDSASMLAIAEGRVRESCAGDSANVRFHRADVRSGALVASDYDLIVTHFFLDCFDEAELARWIPLVAAAARTDARWIVSEFAHPQSGAWRYLSPALVKIIYTFFRLTAGLRARSIPDYAPILARCGFRVERRDTSIGGLLISELWSRAR